jgi:hypothetical protein
VVLNFGKKQISSFRKRTTSLMKGKNSRNRPAFVFIRALEMAKKGKVNNASIAARWADGHWMAIERQGNEIFRT